MRVASEVGNLRAEFGHARPSGSRVIHYVRDGRTDRRTDGRRKAKLTAPFRRGGTIINIQIDRALAAYSINSKFLGGRKHMGYRWWRLLPEAQISVETIVTPLFAAATRPLLPLRGSGSCRKHKVHGDSFFTEGGIVFTGRKHL